jgi:hypothetical protein
VNEGNDRAPRARRIRLPAGSLLAASFADADLADAYAIAVPEEASADVEALARAILANPPAWVRPLMSIRNRIMSRFGVRTSGEISRQAIRRNGRVVGGFPVHRRTADEIVMGADDLHLDFRTSMLLRQARGGRELVWITAVHCHNRLGRLYLAGIKPFHRAIVPAYLDRAAGNGWVPH